MGEDLADGLRRGADLADVLVPGDLLRRQNVLDEEHLVRLNPAAELGGVHPSQVRVNIVADFRLKSYF